MAADRFKALVVRQGDEGFAVGIETLGQSDLPAGDVLVEVAYSSLNYKDGLALVDSSKVLRKYPIVPGIDLAGTVVESEHPDYKEGDKVILTGWGIGETTWGGYSQLARVKSEWLVPLPEGLSLKEAMAIGTAGFTAMLAVMALEDHGMAPEKGHEIAVTGASGGVGSIAVALLAQRGYQVVASTGREESHEYLNQLGAQAIIDRNVLAAKGRPLESERWGGAVDTVGGETLAGLLRAMAYDASVAACGLAGGSSLPTTVLPFILRGVNLLGINSVFAPTERRKRAWERLARELRRDLLDAMTEEISLDDLQSYATQILEGKVRGRTVVSLQ